MVNNANDELKEIYNYCKEKRDKLKKQIIKDGAYNINENFGKFDAYREIVEKLDKWAQEYGIKL